ncbi:uncharacterized protein SCHCODRAFT_02507568, partial [Schizophyllum commune H4-8]|uniref:uncharacterized protein n=1 Tax=Schizophyllum commune (strain H4-8 / FGSC 9210) TaxID=578458 RepID=UPI00215E4D75
MSRLSRAFASSGRGSPPAPVSSPSPEHASDALHISPSPSADGTNDTGPEPLAGVLSPPRAIEASETTTSVAGFSTSDAITSVSIASIDVPAAASDDSMTQMWSQAVAQWQRKMGVDLASSEAMLFSSKDAVIGYIARMEEEEQEAFANGRWKRVRNSFIPLACIFEKLCAFPPSQILFSTLGMIVSASVKTLEEHDQIASAFDEIRTQLQVVEAVSMQAEDLLRDASIRLLIQSITVLQVIVKMKRSGRLRLWLKSLIDMRPLSEALQDLGRLANRHHEVIAGVTYEKVTQMMSSLADERVSQNWVNQSILDLLQLVRRIQENALSTKEDILAHRAVLRRLELSLYLQTNDLKQIKTSVELDKIGQWLGYSNCSSKLSKLLDDRAEGTGSWFLDGDVFAAFREGSIRSVLLNGKAGCGKSTMIAAAAQVLQARCVALTPQPLVLVHLFDTTDGSHVRDLRTLLSALVYQVALKCPQSALTIFEARKRAIENGFATKTDKERLLMSLLRAVSSRVFIVIDALDEAEQTDVLPFLHRLKGISTVSLLASRRTPVNVAHLFDIMVAVGDNDTDSDIGAVLDISLSSGGVLESIRDRDGVRQALLAGAEGNFRWTTLVIQELRSIAGLPGKVRQRLKVLPESLEVLYKGCLDAIDPADRADVRRLLLWLVRTVQ